MDLDFQVPQEIREKVAQRLKNSGALKQIARKIKVGMTAAIHELRDHPDAKSSLELQIFADKSQEEIHALQAIYSFLEERDLTYTLSTLIEEAGVEKADNPSPNLIDIVHSQMNADSDEMLSQDGDTVQEEEDEDEILPDEEEEEEEDQGDNSQNLSDSNIE